jgi:NAD(P)-dependent dehydrogenase (short-subunit alcohol dehydrogenase family)
MQRLAVSTHIVTARLAAPLMVARATGLIVEVTDGVEDRYRGSLYYDLAKSSVIRLARGMAVDLEPYRVASVVVTPGFLRSEAVLDHFGVSAENWREAIAADPHFAASETPRYVGRGIAALAADPEVFARSGAALTSWGLARDYGFTDVDGARPDWGRHFQEHIAGLD